MHLLFIFNFVSIQQQNQLPDESIAALYPLTDNYIIDDHNNGESTHTRSPKTLLKLCTDAVCRNLPRIEGDLPSGILQNLVDDILKSLVKHSALNATTLQALKQCELLELPLLQSCGVSDEWLVAVNDSCNSNHCTVDGDSAIGSVGDNGECKGEGEEHNANTTNSSDEEMTLTIARLV